MGSVGSQVAERNVAISAEVQHLLGVELTQSFLVEFESGSTSGETRHQHYDVDLHRIFVLDGSVEHLDYFVVHEAKGLSVVV